jgi:hypothetical protein
MLLVQLPFEIGGRSAFRCVADVQVGTMSVWFGSVVTGRAQNLGYRYQSARAAQS